jgi:hypothetical protein
MNFVVASINKGEMPLFIDVLFLLTSSRLFNYAVKVAIEDVL